MKNQLQVFENQEFGKIRVIEIDGQPWWVLRDVCQVLGIENSRMVSDRLDNDEKDILKRQPGLPLDVPNRGLTIITESGLYAVILRSEKPKARSFRKWITSEVIPSIRRHGAYITDETLWQMREDRVFADELIEKLAGERAKKEALLDYVSEIAPKARYYDTILKCPNAVQISVIAGDYGMTAIAFNKLLHAFGVQYKIGKTWLLYSKYKDMGYTVTNTYYICGKAASVHTLWTQRGRYFIYDLLRWHGILPDAVKINALMGGDDNLCQ